MNAGTEPQIVMDWNREARTGLVEAVYAAGKPLQSLLDLLQHALAEERRLFLTRLAPEVFAQFPPALAACLDYDVLSRTAVLGGIPAVDGKARVAVVSAGIADAPVTGEVSRTLAFAGVGCVAIADVGVAGLWRLLERIGEIRQYEVVIAVAGMEGALFSVLAGLVAAPVIALPTATGYGVGEGGRLALHSALGSCAPGLVAVNIDNGFGAAQAALRILNACGQPMHRVA